MKTSEAIAIFWNIKSDLYSDEEKGMAIWKVLNMPTHNHITKDYMLEVIRYLMGLAFELPEE